ncbi:DUF4169 family protein [Paracoccus sulfuroxidans]|uniref:DUF4169 family protein n=1 Tax=Paracoccus sulfuroxidans TaxID=384678 RepID=UPI0011A50072|nr:DUF4169 family protein [Paracoccus sulfuroxidans]
MTKVINLRQVRKELARASARRQGDENAAKYGRSKAQKLADLTEAESAARKLDAHRRDDG